MRNKGYFVIIGIILILLIISIPSIIAQDEEDGDFLIFNLELEKILSFINGIIALVLFALAYISYHRDGRKRLLYVAIAFALFSIKGFLLSSQIIFPDIDFMDPLLIVIEFLVLLFFFFGVVKKGG